MEEFYFRQQIQKFLRAETCLPKNKNACRLQLVTIEFLRLHLNEMQTFGSLLLFPVLGGEIQRRHSIGDSPIQGISYHKEKSLFGKSINFDIVGSTPKKIGITRGLKLLLNMPIEIKVFGSGLCTRAKFFFSKCNLSSDGYRIGKNAIYDKNAIYEYVAKFILNYVIDCIFLPYLKPRFHRNAFFVPCHKPRFHRMHFFFTLSQARMRSPISYLKIVSKKNITTSRIAKCCCIPYVKVQRFLALHQINPKENWNHEGSKIVAEYAYRDQSFWIGAVHSR